MRYEPPAINFHLGETPENPCGQGLGVGVAVGGCSLRHNYDPPEQTAVAGRADSTSTGSAFVPDLEPAGSPAEVSRRAQSTARRLPIVNSTDTSP